jgi:hypothetical protein
MFKASVVRVLIASPGDVPLSRAVLREAISDWNGLNAERAGIVLLPVMWERDATPELGAPPQDVINRQLVDGCDIVVACFWTRLGTPTSESASGTVEEIERSIATDKPVMIYFSNEPVAEASVDPEEYQRLNEFRESLKNRGLYGNYGAPEELRRKVNAALTRAIRDRFEGVEVRDPSEGGGQGANVLASVESEREVTGFSNSGSPRYRTHRTLKLENRGYATAEDLSFEILGAHSDQEAPTVLDNEKPVKALPPGGVIGYPLMVAWGMEPQFEIHMEWREGNAAKAFVQTLRI